MQPLVRPMHEITDTTTQQSPSTAPPTQSWRYCCPCALMTCRDALHHNKLSCFAFLEGKPKKGDTTYIQRDGCLGTLGSAVSTTAWVCDSHLPHRVPCRAIIVATDRLIHHSAHAITLLGGRRLETADEPPWCTILIQILVVVILTILAPAPAKLG